MAETPKKMESTASPLSSPLSYQSSPLSSLGRSPSPLPLSPTMDYPSPTSINLPSGTPRDEAHLAPENDRDGPPPAKKRKTTAPKERTTEYLDLGTLGESSDPLDNTHQEIQLNRLVKALQKKRKIVVIAGAGISVSAGIPDFRSSTGLFTTLRSEHKLKASGKHLFDASVYKNNDSTSSFHDMVRELSHLTQNAQPTPFHHLLATLAEEGRLLRLYSQNIDGIDTSLPPLATSVPLRSKGPWPKTIQLHGGLEKMVCTKCGTLSTFKGALFEGPETPVCPDCESMDQARIVAGLRGHGVGRLRPRMVLYNEFNPDEDAIGAVSHADLKSRPDAVIVVGTSLKVPGVRRIAKEMCAVARGRRDGFTAWINNDSEPGGIDFKDSWDLVVRGPCDEVARHACLPKWNEDVEFQVITGEEEKAKLAHDKILSVVVESKQISAVKADDGIITPSATPRQQSPAPLVGLAKVRQPKLFGTPSKPAPEHTASKKAKPGTAKKPVGRPRKQPGAPMNKITSAFTTTKTTNMAKEKVAKTISTREPRDPEADCSQSLFPDLGKQQLFSTTHMRPISPEDHRNNTLPLSENEDTFVTCQEGPGALTTPAKVYIRGGTVSPSSKPAGMAHLMD
ncbi:nad-dependent histone deacetylase sir2 [Phlyctema vagabunda]|uniref:Nad-dependent histone deacetylase sir2 n=1 Tax=Phlyctema vagabunda TaxID=108571 RepID=A0ABR4PXY8_9HELO